MSDEQAISTRSQAFAETVFTHIFLTFPFLVKCRLDHGPKGPHPGPANAAVAYC